MDGGAQPVAGAPGSEVGADSLLTSKDIQDFQRRWDSLQAESVGDPEQALEQADSLVDEVTQRLKDALAERRRWVQARWIRGEQVTSQDVRRAFQFYGAFFRLVLGLDAERAARPTQPLGEAGPVTDSGETPSTESPETATDIRETGDVIEVPIVEEELVKRPVVKEVIRVRKSELTDQRTVDADRRTEEVEVIRDDTTDGGDEQ